MERRKMVVVTFSYEPAEVDELKLDVGDIIEVMAEIEEGWWRGKKADRTVGLFPSNFVQPVEQQSEANVHNSEVVLSSVECEKLGTPATIHIDASLAGPGELEVFVSVGPINLLCEVKQVGKAKFIVTFVPKEMEIHTIVVKFNGEFVPGSPVKFTPVEMKQTVTAAINESIFVEESSEVVMVEECAPSRSPTISFGSDIESFRANSASDGYFALAMVINVTKTDATAITASRRQFPLLATQFQPGQTLKCRGVDLRVYLRPNDPLKLWLERENLIAAVVNTDGYGREDGLSRGVVDSITPPVGNIWSSTLGNIQFRIDKVAVRVGDSVKFKQNRNDNGPGYAEIVGLVEDDLVEMISASSVSATPTDVPTPTVARATVTLAGSTQLSSQSQAVSLPQRRKSPQDFIDLLLTVSRQSDSAVTRHSGIGLITTAYQQVARIYCQTGELVPINSEDFICDPNVPLYDLFKPLMVAKYVFERSYNVEIQNWQERLLFLQLTNDPFPYWDQLDVCEAEVTGHLDSRDYFSGVYIKTGKLSKLMMPRYAYFHSVSDLTAKMPIGRKVTVIVAPNSLASDMPEHSSHHVIMCAPPGVSSRMELISKAADVQVSTGGRGGFSDSDPTPLVDLREEILQRPNRYSPAVFNSGKVAPPPNPILWPSGATLRVERGVGLITTIYRKCGQMWIPNHGSEIFHVDGLHNVRCKYLGQLVKPLQLARFTRELSNRKNDKGESSSIIELEPIQGDEVEFPWDQLHVCHSRVIKPLPNKKPTANKSGFSAVLLKSSKFYGKLIFLPNYAYPHYTMDLPTVLPVESHLNVVVFRQGLRRGKEVIPLAAVACVPSHVLTIADLKRYVTTCPP